jgi:hypothetical protein
MATASTFVSFCNSIILHLTHLTQAVQRNLMELSTFMIEVPPPGCTSRAQVLDVGINKPLKVRMRSQAVEWMLENQNEKVSRMLVSNWIAKSWEDISS